MNFYKYQGTGNDFIMIDNRSNSFDISNHDFVASLCHRRFGIGADGLILLRNHEELDFEMVYFNADGKPGTMCGNGGRCAVAFAKHLDIITDNFSKFMASDGVHEALISNSIYVELKMIDVKEVHSNQDKSYVINTGSPHYVICSNDIKKLDVVNLGKAIRYNETYHNQGINVNFVECIDEGIISVRTYERGVEDETYSCGTGAVAAAIASFHWQQQKQNEYKISTLGGELLVRFSNSNNVFTNVWLCGPATRVYSGSF